MQDSKYQVTHLPLTEIVADSEFNCRGEIHRYEVEELAEDIANEGLQTPIIVRPFEGKYKIVVGHRRYKAFQVLKKDTIPCMIRDDVTEEQAIVMNLAENIHRKDLNLMQEANGIRYFKEKGMTFAEIADKVKMSVGWVQVRHNLLDLPPDVQEEAAAGFLTQQHIKDLYQMTSYKDMVDAIKEIKDARLRHNKKTINISKGAKKKKKDPTRTRERGREEIFRMQEFIQDNLKENSNFGARCLAWAAGEISSNALYLAIKRQAEERGIRFIPPLVDVSAPSDDR